MHNSECKKVVFFAGFYSTKLFIRRPGIEITIGDRWKPLIAWKVSKYGVFSGPYSPAFGLNTDQKKLHI